MNDISNMRRDLFRLIRKVEREHASVSPDFILAQAIRRLLGRASLEETANINLKGLLKDHDGTDDQASYAVFP